MDPIPDLRELTVFIPGLPLGMNAFRQRNTRGRMSVVKSEREKARMCALAAVRTKYPSGRDTWVGPTVIDFEVRTSRVFKDQLVMPAALKHVQDGVCLAVLPLGDGHKTPYRWNMPSQVRVKRRAEEGVLVTIRSATP